MLCLSYIGKVYSFKFLPQAPPCWPSEYDQFVFGRHEFDSKTNQPALALIDMSEVEMYKTRDRGVSDGTDIGLRSFLYHCSSSKLHQSTHTRPRVLFGQIEFNSNCVCKCQWSKVWHVRFKYQKKIFFVCKVYLTQTRNFLTIIQSGIKRAF